MNADIRYSLFAICCATDGNATNAARISPRITHHASRITGRHAFTLVEVALAIAVVAIGLVGVLALFPLGLRATRGAMDDTQMATIGQEFIAKYQQMALTNVNYDTANGDVLTNGVSTVTFPPLDGVSYTVRTTITNDGFPPIQMAGGTNLVCRVYIEVWRPGSKTNLYITEVARYVQP